MARRRFWRKRTNDELPQELQVEEASSGSPVERVRSVDLDPFNPPDAKPSLKVETAPLPVTPVDAVPSARVSTPEILEPSRPASRRPVDLEITEEPVPLTRKGQRDVKKALRDTRRKAAQHRRNNDGVVEPAPDPERRAADQTALSAGVAKVQGDLSVEKERAGSPPPVDRNAAFSEAARIRRKANKRATRRRILKLMVAGGSAVAMVAASVLGSIWWQGRSSEVVVTIPPVATSGDGESLLVALMDGDAAVGFALVTAHPSLEDRIVLVPPSLLVILPGYGRFELADAIEFGGPDLAALAMTNLTGARIDHSIRASVTSFSKALDGVSLELPNPVVVVEGNDQVVAAAAGVAVRDAAHLRVILGVAGIDDQLTLLVRQQLVWQAVLASQVVDSGTLAEALIGAQGDRAGALNVLRAVSEDELARVASVPVSAVDALGGTTETYKMGVSDAQAMIATQAPYLAIVEGERHRVEILNGTAVPGVAVPIAARLVREGFRVIRTDNADHFGYLSTRVIGHTSDNQNAALRIGGILGVDEIHLEQRQPSGIVDVTIIVGEDMT